MRSLVANIKLNTAYDVYNTDAWQ